MQEAKKGNKALGEVKGVKGLKGKGMQMKVKSPLKVVNYEKLKKEEGDKKSSPSKVQFEENWKLKSPEKENKPCQLEVLRIVETIVAVNVSPSKLPAKEKTVDEETTVGVETIVVEGKTGVEETIDFGNGTDKRTEGIQWVPTVGLVEKGEGNGCTCECVCGKVGMPKVNGGRKVKERDRKVKGYTQRNGMVDENGEWWEKNGRWYGQGTQADGEGGVHKWEAVWEESGDGLRINEHYKAWGLHSGKEIYEKRFK